MATVDCGCLKCSVYCAPTRGCFDYCLREYDYTEKMKARGYARFEDLATMDTGFRPATQEQLDEWTSWLATPDARSAATLVHFEENAPLYNTYKFDVAAMERHADNLWPEQKSNFLLSSMWLAYQLYMKEQHELKKAYDAVKKNIKTDEAYEKAEDAYKTLIQHINMHGQLIRELPEYEHKRPMLVAPPTNLRRRGQKVAC